MKIDVSHLVRGPLERPSIVVKPPDQTQTISISRATRVTISEEARAAASSEASAAGKDYRPMQGLSLEQLVGQYDYESITPYDFAWLAGELYARGEISQAAAGSFVGTNLDKVEPISRHDPINMVAHMDEMLASAKTASAYATRYHTEVRDTLSNIVAFAKGERATIK